jgi:polyhydroxyalkanoate synthesis regulator phasin
MDATRMTKQMIDFQKTTFDNTFNAMVMLQDQAERMAHTLLEQATWMPEEGRKAVREWVAAYKNGREEFKKNVDQSFKKVEDFFEGAQKKAEAKAK